MRTNLIFAAGLVALLGLGGRAMLQSNQLSVLPIPRALVPAKTAHEAEASSRTPSADKPHESNVVRSKARVRTIELPYFVVHDTGDDLLLSERKTPLRVAGSTSEWRMARTALTALEGFPRAEGRYQNPLPEGARILGVHLDITSGIASVNLSRAFRENFNGGARAEQMTVYALVNTVGSIPGVRGVTFQIQGRPIQEFAGHLDLSEPLVPDNSIVEKDS